MEITTPPVLDGHVDAPVKLALSASGGVAPLTWTIVTGALPPGLHLDSANAVVAGTPSEPWWQTVEFAVSDSTEPTPQTATGLVTFHIDTAPGAPEISTKSLASGIVGRPYEAAMQGAGGTPPYSWSVSGLPPGLQLEKSAGTISGAPQSAGAFLSAVTLTDAAAKTAAASLTVTVADPLAVTTASLPQAAIGQPYAASLQASGGLPPYAWSLSSGSLPGGLALDPTSGALSGTPTSGASSACTFAVADSAGQSASASLTLVVAAVPARILSFTSKVRSIIPDVRTGCTIAWNTQGATKVWFDIAAGQFGPSVEAVGQRRLEWRDTIAGPPGPLPPMPSVIFALGSDGQQISQPIQSI